MSYVIQWFFKIYIFRMYIPKHRIRFKYIILFIHMINNSSCWNLRVSTELSEIYCSESGLEIEYRSRYSVLSSNSATILKENIIRFIRFLCNICLSHLIGEQTEKSSATISECSIPTHAYPLSFLFTVASGQV